MPRSPLIAAVEAGGTKMVAALASGPEDIRVTARIPTTKPEETLPAILDFFREATKEHGQPEALGIGSFGPVDLDAASPTYGFITSTPKLAWQNADILGQLSGGLDLPGYIDTDVNAAALAEWRWGAAQGLNNLVYITVGTGIGGGVLVNGQPVHGLLHPEVGHMRIPRSAEEVAAFDGICPFHGDCLEGLASGPAIEARWGKPGHELPTDHPAWEIQAAYLGDAIVNLSLCLSPQCIILGGGVLGQEQLLPMVRRRVTDRLNGYLQHETILSKPEAYIQAPGLGTSSGLLGAVALAQAAIGTEN